MHPGRRLRALARLWLALAPLAAAAEPLDVNDPTPRSVIVQLENSSNLATVGQSFGAPLSATYSASGGTGTLVIPIASHQAMRGGTPVPGSFTAYVISIDVVTGAATSQPASGAVLLGPGQAAVFAQQALGTGTLAGFMDNVGIPPIFCTSQADVEAACQINPIPEVCDATCVVVPGASFDPVSGKLNLVGAEQREICGGSGCFGAHTAFSHLGDLRLSEATVVPALPWPAAAALWPALLAAAALARRLRRSRGALLLAAVLVLPAAARALEPLDVNDPTPRSVVVELEVSTAPGTVGQSFGTPLAATYSASGATGTLVIPVESHEAMRGDAITPVPGSFTPIVIEIDLATGAATSQPAGGAQASGGQSFSFSMSALSTSGSAGFVGPNFPPLFCSSQQQIDDLCPTVPSICGKTCTQVPGVDFEPATGKLNLVGSEVQQGCDGSFCQGPFTMFSTHGDLRLSEAPVVPVLPPAALALLLVCLLAAVPRRPKLD